MLLLCDLYIPGRVRERLLVAFYRYSTTQSQSNVDDVCKLLRDTGYDQQQCRRPSDYPVEFFRLVVTFYFLCFIYCHNFVSYRHMGHSVRILFSMHCLIFESLHVKWRNLKLGYVLLLEQ